MKQIPTMDFLTFVKTKEGHELQTSARKAKFSVRVTKSGLEFLPHSTMKPRPHDLGRLERILQQFAETESYKTNEYKHCTICSSYTLTLINQYLAEHSP